MKNETRIREDLSKSLSIDLKKAEFTFITDTVKTSVDFVLKLDEYNFLFEVDSNNAAKIVFGQYMLLNKSRNLAKNSFLVIIHCYKGYNIERTIKHLNYAKDAYNCKIPFVILSEKEWILNTKDKSKIQIEQYLVSLT